MRIEDAVTGQQELVDGGLERLPAIGEGHEFVPVDESAVSRPYVAGVEFWPKGYCQVFKARRRGEVHIPRNPTGDDLNGDMPQGESAYVHLDVVNEGELSLEMERDESPTVPVSRIGT